MKQSKTASFASFVIAVTMVTLGAGYPSTTVNVTASLKPGWMYTIQSPSYPNQYPPNTTCIWKIMAPNIANYDAHVILDHFEIEPCSDCNCDFLRSSSSKRNLGVATSQCSLKSHKYIKELPFEQRMRSFILGGHREVWIQFKSDGSNEFKGFHGEVRAVKRGRGVCSSYLRGTSGTIASPKYPSLYQPTQSCTWHIVVPDGFKVQLTFTAFHLENTKNEQSDCVNDYVEIREGVWGRYGPILGRFCGDVIPTQVTSPTNQMWVLFDSDRNDTTVYKGFRADFVIVSGSATITLYTTSLVLLTWIIMCV